MALIRRFFRDPSQYDEGEHIRWTLHGLLNERRGWSTPLLDAGFEPVDDPRDRRLLREFEGHLTTMLARYEPRVELVSVSRVLTRGAKDQVRVEVRSKRDGHPIALTFGRDGAELV